MNRVKTIASQIQQPTSSEADNIAGPSKVMSVHENAWGYKDTEFSMSDDGIFSLSGSRYLYSGKTFPQFYTFIQRFGVDKDMKTPPQRRVPVGLPNKNDKLIRLLGERVPHCVLSFEDSERLMASHGHTVQEMWELRFGRFEKIVDAANCEISNRLWSGCYSVWRRDHSVTLTFV